MNPKFRLTEDALKILTSSGIDPEAYASNLTVEGGLQLFNAGPETTILGRTKYVAFGEKNVGFKTGIRLALAPGQLAMVMPTPSILASSLLAPTFIFGPGYSNEVLLSFHNIGENDVLIKQGNPLPAQLIFLSGVQKPELVSDLEYLKTSSTLNSN